MRRVTATEFQRNFARFQHDRETVAVTSHGRTTGYFVSPEEYAELDRLRTKARRVLRVGELPDDTVRALKRSRMDPRHASLDGLMDE
ncbi:MAG TPA: type II toxin-antitoxin system Phd/YefM family antitoxin [Beijerinckiaceae bacterium]|nr:type II toxin-antitoxin system Phd/YefM family antitoxin [Beijerinckiaceae bacterium]